MTAFVSVYLYRGSWILEHVNAKIGVVQKLLDIIIYMNISLFGYVLAHLLSLKSRPLYISLRTKPSFWVKRILVFRPE